MTERENRIYEVHVRPQLQAYGAGLSQDEVSVYIQELPNQLRIGRDEIEIDNEVRDNLVDYALTDFGLKETEHVYIRGGGFFRNDEETELEKETWRYYHKHRNFISDHVFSGQPNVVESIDFETDQIIKKIPNPTKEGNEQYLNKGLVLGYVQSGKTANFTHLISKAASIGYKFIVVLAGMTNTLRNQTQYRIDRELTGNNQFYNDGGTAFVRWNKSEEKYLSLTRAPSVQSNDDGDFHIPVSNFSSHFGSTNDVSIAVVKKLARIGNEHSPFGSVLGRLIRWIENRTDQQAKMPPLLIIDDEADQASIDASDPDQEPTTINHAIRYLISLFDQVSYVGYTATPFANVFIDANDTFNNLPDLYPEDFIYSLPEPSNYFGANQFFGANANGELAYINTVPDNERAAINNVGDGNLTESLVDAFWDFVFATMIRRFRGDNGNSGFMIHTDHRNVYQDIVRNKVVAYRDEIKDDFNVNQMGLRQEIEQHWERYSGKCIEIATASGYNHQLPDFDGDRFFETSKEIISRIVIKVVNSKEDNLSYQSGEDLSTLICIGGNIMSRGVTIEGLTISYYLRESPKYDTLLQMARWYGYRVGYEDLLRVYTTQTIKEYYEYIMGVEEDLRSEVRRYQEERLTPREFAPRVRAHMRMLPSAKMGVASRQKSYSKQSAQTIYFSRDVDVLSHNDMVVREFLEKLNVQYVHGSGNYDFLEAEPSLLLGFLNDFILADAEIRSFDVDDVLRYLNVRTNSGEILSFDVRVAGRANPREGAQNEEFGNDIVIYPVKRNARKGTGWRYLEDGLVNIGVISDSNDIPSVDEEDLARPRLIIYSVDYVNSNSFKEVTRNPDGSIEYGETAINGLNFNPKGFALVFPPSQTQAGEYDYYQQIFER